MTISILGQILVLASLACAIIGTVVGYSAGVQRSDALTQSAKKWGLGFAGSMIAANILMVYALLTHDFTVTYVAEVGSKQISTYFTIVSLWASLSGSILLWGGVLGIYVIGLIVALGNKHQEYMSWTIGTLLFVCIFFAGLVATVSDPFAATEAPVLREMCLRYGCSPDGVPLDGPGPNPLLQNHWLMAFHPPTLYLGYVGMALPFAMICGALFAGRLEAGWITPLRRIFLVPWAFLTAGIIMGGWWSYAVLGWGGFWAWDPVENASFMPWLTGTAFLHSAMLMQRRERLRTWTLILGMVTFLLTLFGTFLTRSGVFNSVHAFADGPVGPIFLGYVGVMLLFSVVLLSLQEHTLHSDVRVLPSLAATSKTNAKSNATAWKGGLLAFIFALGPAVGVSMTLWYSVSDDLTTRALASFGWYPALLFIPVIFAKTNNRMLGRELAIVLQNFAFCLFTFVVMLGTVYPILAEALREKKVSVGEPYFDKFAFPIGMTIIALMAIGPALPWGRASVERAWVRFAVPLSVAVVGIGGMLLTGVDKPYVLLSFGLCLFALVTNADEFLFPVRQRRAKGESIWTATIEVAKRGRRRFGGHVAHLGVIMAVLSITVAKGYRHEEFFTTGPGNTHQFEEYTFEFTGTDVVDEGFRTSTLGNFAVTRNGEAIGTYAPKINTYTTRREPLPAPVSLVRWDHDLQLTLMSAEEDGSFAYLRVIKTPYITWLWFSSVLVVFGTGMSVWPSRKKSGPENRKAA